MSTSSTDAPKRNKSEPTDNEIAVVKALRPYLEHNTNGYRVMTETGQKIYIPLTNIPLEDAVDVLRVLNYHRIDYNYKDSKTFGAPVIVLDPKAARFNEGLSTYIPGIVPRNDMHFVFPEKEGDAKAFNQAVIEKRAADTHGYKLELAIPEGITGRRLGQSVRIARQVMCNAEVKYHEGVRFISRPSADWTFDLSKLVDHETLGAIMPADIGWSTQSERRRLRGTIIPDEHNTLPKTVREDEQLRKDVLNIIEATVQRDAPQVKHWRKGDTLVCRVPDGDKPQEREVSKAFGNMLSGSRERGAGDPKNFDSHALYSVRQLERALQAHPWRDRLVFTDKRDTPSILPEQTMANRVGKGWDRNGKRIPEIDR